MPPFILEALVGFLVSTATKLVTNLIDQKFPATKVQQIQEDPRYLEALGNYLQCEGYENANSELAISTLKRSLLREFQEREIQLKLQEIEANWDRDNWFSTLSREETKRILLNGQNGNQLLLLASPPNISQDCPESFLYNLEKEIMNGLKVFLVEQFSNEKNLYSVEFLGKYFNRSIFDVEIKQLKYVLSPMPTAVLYSDITDYEFFFNIGFWGFKSDNISLVSTQGYFILKRSLSVLRLKPARRWA